MKTLIITLLVMGLFVVPVMANETEGADYSSPNGHVNWLADVLNEQDCIDHTHQYDVPERDNPMGAGLDLIVYENRDSSFQAVTIEGKYDFKNEEASVFAVATVNLWKFFTGK